MGNEKSSVKSVNGGESEDSEQFSVGLKERSMTLENLHSDKRMLSNGSFER